MKILAVSDEVVERLYNIQTRANYPEIRMILGCGDLSYDYLEFLLTILNAPLYYVPGNHDPKYSLRPGAFTQGGTNLDGEVVFDRGLLIAGMGGSILYSRAGYNQYTQAEMFQRAYRLVIKIWMKTFRLRRRLDILITHSPPFGIHDDPEDPAHNGLRALNFILRLAKPRYMLHGHTFFYKRNIREHETIYQQTCVTNVYPFRVLDISPDQSPSSQP